MRPLRVFLPCALLATAAACGSISGDDDDDDDSADASIEIDADPGVPDADPGVPDADPGVPDADPGVPDARPDPDARRIDDAGPDPDAHVHDAGPVPDAVPVPDGGGTVGETCADLCATIDACFGGEPGCIAECSDALVVCSSSELAELSACADLPCDDFEACVLTVDCIGGGEPVCGDGTCDAGETCGTCADDCGACVCGDGVCSRGECAVCEADCPGGCSCPHDVCKTGDVLDPGCGECVADICAVDPYCCDSYWDELCVSEAESVCGKDCPDVDPPPPDEP